MSDHASPERSPLDAEAFKKFSDKAEADPVANAPVLEDSLPAIAARRQKAGEKKIAKGKADAAKREESEGQKTEYDPICSPEKAEVSEYDLEKIAKHRQKLGEQGCAQGAAEAAKRKESEGQKTEYDQGVNGAQEPSPEDRKNKLREKYKDLKSKPLSEATEELPAVLIESILRQRRRMLICGASKGRKTWLCMQIAFCVSKGLQLFGRFKTKKVPVLYANLELLEADAKRRFKAIAEGLNYTGDPYENLRIISATEFMDVIGNDFADFLALQAADDAAKMVCIDPLWRLLGDRDENSVTDMGKVLKPFAKFSREADASAATVQHFPKGNAAGKEAIDRAAGSGGLGRDAATVMVMTNLKVSDGHAIEIVGNDFAPIEPFAIRYNYPVFELAPDLDPAELKKPAAPVAEIKKGVQQTETVLSVLYARDYQGGLRHTDIVRFTGFPKGTITKILKAETKPKGRIVKSPGVGEKREVYLLSPAYRSQRDRENAAKTGENDDFDPEMDANAQK